MSQIVPQTRHFLQVATVLLAACGSTAPAKPSGPPELYTKDEVAALDAKLRARLVTSPPAACTRGLLRETAGAASTPLAVFDVCAANRGAWTPASVKQLVANNAPEIAAWDAACGAPLATAVAAAIAHPASCSPYELGATATPAPAPAAQLVIAQLLAVHARAIAVNDSAEALWLRLEGVRMWRDLRRGHTPLPAATTAAEATRILLDDLLADLVAKVPSNQVDALITAVDALIADEPSLLGAFRANEVATAQTAQTTPQPIKPFGPLTARAMMIDALDSNEAAVAAACPQAASHLACMHGLFDASERVNHDADANGHTEAKLMRVVTRYTMGQQDPASRDEIRAGILDIMRGDTLRSNSTYLPKAALILSDLAALRIALELKRRGCPTAAQLSGPPWTELATPARLGDGLLVSRTETAVVIEAPTWITNTVKTPTFVVACGQ